MFQCRGTNGFRRQDEKCSLFPAAEQREVGTSIQAHHPLLSTARTDLVFGRMLQVVRSNPSNKVCDLVDAPASFNSDVWKHFGFCRSRNEKGAKMLDREDTTCQTLAGSITVFHKIKAIATYECLH